MNGRKNALRVISLFLGIGFAVGLLAGTVADGSTDAARASNPSTDRARRLPDSDHAAATPARRPARSDEDVEAARESGAPATGFLGQMGRLIVERPESGDLSQWFSLRGTNMFGDPEAFQVEIEAGTNKRTLNVAVGDYELWWGEEHAMQKTRVRIKQGVTKRVQLEPKSEIPRGCGRVECLVHDLDGSPMQDFTLSLYGASGTAIEEDPLGGYGLNGRVTQNLLPGPYGLAFGDHFQWCRVVEGETTTVEFRSTHYGEVRIDTKIRERQFALRSSERERTSEYGFPPRWRYVPPGIEKVLWYPHGLTVGRHVGTARVEAGKQTVVVPRFAKGALEVAVLFSARDSAERPDQIVTVFHPGGEDENLDGDVEGGKEHPYVFPALKPGKYRISVLAKGCHVQERKVEVRAESVSVEFTLDPDPSLDGGWPD